MILMSVRSLAPISGSGIGLSSPTASSSEPKAGLIKLPSLSGSPQSPVRRRISDGALTLSLTSDDGGGYRDTRHIGRFVDHGPHHDIATFISIIYPHQFHFITESN